MSLSSESNILFSFFRTEFNLVLEVAHDSKLSRRSGDLLYRIESSVMHK